MFLERFLDFWRGTNLNYVPQHGKAIPILKYLIMDKIPNHNREKLKKTPHLRRCVVNRSMFLLFSNVIQVAIQGWTQYEQVVGGGVLPKMTILYVEYLNS